MKEKSMKDNVLKQNAKLYTTYRNFVRFYSITKFLGLFLTLCVAAFKLLTINLTIDEAVLQIFLNPFVLWGLVLVGIGQLVEVWYKWKIDIDKLIKDEKKEQEEINKNF